jgi:hypothetical protein
MIPTIHKKQVFGNFEWETFALGRKKVFFLKGRKLKFFCCKIYIVETESDDAQHQETLTVFSTKENLFTNGMQ